MLYDFVNRRRKVGSELLITSSSPNTTSRTFDIRRNSNLFQEFQVPANDESFLEGFTGGEKLLLCKTSPHYSLNTNNFNSVFEQTEMLSVFLFSF